MPSWPSQPTPQQYAAPPDVRPQMCSSPVVTDVKCNVESSAACHVPPGVGVVSVTKRSEGPIRNTPQQSVAPSDVKAQVLWSPALIDASGGCAPIGDKGAPRKRPQHHASPWASRPQVCDRPAASATSVRSPPTRTGVRRQGWPPSPASPQI